MFRTLLKMFPSNKNPFTPLYPYIDYATSVIASRPLVSNMLGEAASPAGLPPALLARLSLKQGEEATDENLQGVAQKAVSFKIDTHNRLILSDLLTREGDVREIARLASLGLPHAGDYLNVVPNPNFGLHLRAPELVATLRYRLGCPVYPVAGPCPACDHLCDRLGDHAMNCGTQGERIGRHNRLRDAVHSAAASAGLGPVLEERFLLPGGGRKPADVLIPNWSRGQDAALDVTVINSLQDATVVGAAEEPGHALTVAFNRKVNKVGEACRREGIAFIPLAFEALGGWHEVAVREMKKLSASLARQRGDEEKEAARTLFQRLSLLLMRGNAALFLNRMPET